MYVLEERDDIIDFAKVYEKLTSENTLKQNKDE